MSSIKLITITQSDQDHKTKKYCQRQGSKRSNQKPFMPQITQTNVKMNQQNKIKAKRVNQGSRGEKVPHPLTNNGTFPPL